MIGKLLNKKYIVLKYVGRGTFSKVWLVLDIIENKYLSLKIQEPEDLEEMEQEIKSLMYKRLQDLGNKMHRTDRKSRQLRGHKNDILSGEATQWLGL